MPRCAKPVSWLLMLLLMPWLSAAETAPNEKAEPVFAPPLFNAADAAGSPEQPTPLEQAILANDLDAAREALQGGAKVNAASLGGSYPLLLAAAHADGEMLKLLIAEDAVLHVRDAKGRNAVHYLAMRGATEEMKLVMIMNRTLALYEDNDGWTPLYTAYANGHMNTAEYLMDEEFDHLNRPDEAGVTRAFHFVMRTDSPAALAHMIDRKLNLFKRNQADLTLHEVAEEVGHEASAELLEANYERILDEYKRRLEKEQQQ